MEHSGSRLSVLLHRVIDDMSVTFWFLAIFLAVSSLTRISLILLHINEITDSLWLMPLNLMIGVVFDLVVGLYVTLPLVLFLLVMPQSWRKSSIVTWLFLTAGAVFTYGVLYLGVTELFFFDEFSSRFNYVAVDYLIYPHEVFINIWDTYPVLQVLIGVGIVSLVVVWLLRKKITNSLQVDLPLRRRFGALFAYVVLIAAGTLSLNIDSARVSDNRIFNELASNGVYSFVYAARTNELDYHAYYRQMDESQAFRILRDELRDDNDTFLKADDSGSIARFVNSNRETHHFNIVLVLEESFGSKFVGSLHPKGPSLTPHFDSLADDGLLFTHVYATGNRTVRGLEASLTSLPPIPGRSIVKRPGCEDVFSLPALLREIGYSTVFLYGGLSYFDNFGHFAESNGFEKVIDEMDMDDHVFSTIWGVSDEDLFNHSLRVFDSLSQTGSPFFATMITVSNHTPYTYPEGRIPFDPNEHKRANAVRYADYAIGKFIRDARKHEFFDSTLFVFLADHGARVYGSQQIPFESYEIPVLFYCPSLIPEPERVNILGSQMDLAPTMLDFLGIDYNSEFFGRSLLATSPDEARALLSHNRDVSLLKGDQLAVLGIQGNEELWRVNDSTGQLSRIADTKDSSLIADAISYYMIAYDMFEHHQLRPLQQYSSER